MNFSPSLVFIHTSNSNFNQIIQIGSLYILNMGLRTVQIIQANQVTISDIKWVSVTLKFRKKNSLKIHNIFLLFCNKKFMIKCSSEILQNFSYLYVWTLEYETPSIVFLFHFVLVYFPPNSKNMAFKAFP